MTEQEAELLTKRLIRVWEVVENQGGGIGYNGKFSFSGQWSGNLNIFVEVIGGEMCIELTELDWDANNVELVLTAHPYEILDYRGKSPFDFDHPTAEDLDHFRRCCWLSGCPIEASAHEKSEWMQGCTHEEIKAWNLKM